jgi:8-oxo-dGTP pyrophosphatase MutT (NUDIX family)
MTITGCGRPAYVVNVSVFLRRSGRWLLIRRGAGESPAPGQLGDVGGKVDSQAAAEPDILESTARREVLEEVGLDLTGVPLRFAESALFTTDDGDPVVNVLFAADLPRRPATAHRRPGRGGRVGLAHAGRSGRPRLSTLDTADAEGGHRRTPRSESPARNAGRARPRRQHYP